METRLQRRRTALGQGEAPHDSAQGRRLRRSPATAACGGASATPLVNELLFEACHEALENLELLRAILERLGKGHFCFVAGVSKDWKASYTALYPAVETVFSSVVSSVECVNWATGRQGLELTGELFRAAAEHGDVEVCKALHGKDCPWDEYVYIATVRNREYGLRVLKWLRLEDLPDKEQCPWDRNGSEMCAVAVLEGRLEMLKWLLSDDGGVDFDAVSWNSACIGGHIPVVEWLLEHPPTRAVLEENEDGEWRKGAFYAAAGGHLEVLQLLHANARHLCDWDWWVCSCAVMKGKSLAVLKWLRSEEVQCEWDEESCPQVIRDRGVYEELHGEGAVWDIDAKTFEEIKQWVHANGHPCNCED